MSNLSKEQLNIERLSIEKSFSERIKDHIVSEDTSYLNSTQKDEAKRMIEELNTIESNEEILNVLKNHNDILLGNSDFLFKDSILKHITESTLAYKDTSMNLAIYLLYDSIPNGLIPENDRELLLLDKEYRDSLSLNGVKIQQQITKEALNSKIKFPKKMERFFEFVSFFNEIFENKFTKGIYYEVVENNINGALGSVFSALLIAKFLNEFEPERHFDVIIPTSQLDREFDIDMLVRSNGDELMEYEEVSVYSIQSKSVKKTIPINGISKTEINAVRNKRKRLHNLASTEYLKQAIPLKTSIMKFMVNGKEISVPVTAIYLSHDREVYTPGEYKADVMEWEDSYKLLDKKLYDIDDFPKGRVFKEKIGGRDGMYYHDFTMYSVDLENWRFIELMNTGDYKNKSLEKTNKIILEWIKSNKIPSGIIGSALKLGEVHSSRELSYMNNKYFSILRLLEGGYFNQINISDIQKNAGMDPKLDKSLNFSDRIVKLKKELEIYSEILNQLFRNQEEQLRGVFHGDNRDKRLIDEWQLRYKKYDSE